MLVVVIDTELHLPRGEAGLQMVISHGRLNYTDLQAHKL